MNLSLRTGTLIVAVVLGATALGLAIMLARDPALLKRIVRRGAISYLRAMEMIAEAREQLGDVLAEALQEAEDELRGVQPYEDDERPASAA